MGIDPDGPPCSAPHSPALAEVLCAANLADEYHQLTSVLEHQCPQNRAKGSEFCTQTPGYVVWFVQCDGEAAILREPDGLLSLTGWNAPPAQRQQGDVPPSKHAPTSAYYAGQPVERRDVILYVTAKTRELCDGLRRKIEWPKDYVMQLRTDLKLA